ncbi:MAG: GerMN domain-containing protein [Eubacteriales bacterium]|nr:GerMN domain-containing protein [Eubacteriales bacterium]
MDRRDKRISARTGRLFSLLAVLSCVFCLLCAGGCRAGETEDGKLQVFYLNSGKTGLVSRSIELRTESSYGRAQETLELLAEDLPEEGLLAPVSGFICEDFSIEKNTIILEFSASYRDLDIITEKLTRAAIVNTLCGLDGIRRVTIRANGALLMDERGNKSENMTADQFIYSSGNEMINYESAEIHLYFASEDGKKLVETYRTVVFNTNIPMERLVVEQIISGPKGDFNYPTVNEGTRIVNIVTRDDLCTVTLDKTFLTNPHAVDPEVALYSIVNSLTELPSIRQVQILIDGEEAPLFMDKYVLDTETLLQKNPDLVQTRD